MKLTSIKLVNFKNYSEATFHFDKKINLSSKILRQNNKTWQNPQTRGSSFINSIKSYISKFFRVSFFINKIDENKIKIDPMTKIKNRSMIEVNMKKSNYIT